MTAEIVEYQVAPGESILEVLHKIRESGEGYSELQAGEIVLARAKGPARPCPPGCDMCCRLPGLAATKKPPMTPCRHLNERKHKCSVYADRPAACQKYFCSWAIGNFLITDRPDKIGAVAGVYEHEGQLLGAILVDSKTANWPRIAEMFRKFALSLPWVQMIVDDNDVVTIKNGVQRHGKIQRRPLGDYESTIVAFE